MSKATETQAMRLHEDAPLTDIHIHPSLKAYLFDRNLWKHTWSGKPWDPFASRSDFVMLDKGGVSVLWAAHYLPERGIFQNSFLARIAASLVVPRFGAKMSGSQFDRLLDMMDALEREIDKRPDHVELALSAADVKRIHAAGKIAVVHHVEGGHVLEADPERMEHRLDVLADRGVAMFTLAHFYPNDIAGHVDGVPKKMFLRKICGFKFGTDDVEPLTDFGRDVIRKLKSLPMIVDVSHCSPAARAEIYSELGTDRPVVASHVGAYAVNPDKYNPTDEEIRHIANTCGVIGVIFLTYWLDAADPKQGLPAIWKTMEHIHDVTGSWDHVAIGTDFDGFTDPPDDLRDASAMPKVTSMLLERGVEEDDVKKILGGNAQRVLEIGWR